MRKLHQKLFWLLIFLLPVQFGRHFWPDWAYVLGLRVDYLAPTIYLTDILVVGILGLWGISKLKITNKNLKNLILPFGIFLFLLANSLLAQNTGAALYKFVKIVEFSLLGLYVAKNFSISQYPSILISLSLAVIYSSLIAIFQFFKQASLGGVFWWLGERTFNVGTPGIAKAMVDGQLIMRPYGIFPHPNVLAGFLLIGLILTFHHVLQRRNKLLVISYLLLVIFALALSFSRSAWLVGLLVGLWVLLKHLRGALRLSPSHLGGGILVAILSIVLLIKLPFSTDESISQRLQLIKAASLMIQTAPSIGVGLNNFIVHLPAFWQITGSTYWLQPVHNIYLLVATETGLVGLVIFLWFLFLTYRRLLKRPPPSQLTTRPTTHNPLLIPLSVILILGLFDHYWLTLQQTQLLFSIVLGLSWAKPV